MRISDRSSDVCSSDMDNPQITGEHVHGEFVWRELSQIGEPIDLVDIFRRPQAAGEAVDQAIAAGAKAVWMQLGVINEEAAARAEAAGDRKSCVSGKGG